MYIVPKVPVMKLSRSQLRPLEARCFETNHIYSETLKIGLQSKQCVLFVDYNRKYLILIIFLKNNLKYFLMKNILRNI